MNPLQNQTPSEDYFPKLRRDSQAPRDPSDILADRIRAEELKKHTAHNSPIQTLRTFEGDAADAVKNNNQSLASIAQAEQDRRHERSLETEEKKSGVINFVLIFLSILLLAGSAAIVLYFFVIKEPAEQTPVVITRPTPIPAQRNLERTLSKDTKTSIIEAFQSVVNANSTVGITAVALNKNDGSELSSREFVEILEPNILPAFTRSLKDMYMLGISNTESKGNIPFFILKTELYQNAYAGMLDWEQRMYASLKDLLASEKVEGLITQTTVSPFSDMLLKNKDVRAIQSTRGPVLLYSFINNETIAITTDESVLVDLIGRVTTAELVR